MAYLTGIHGLHAGTGAAAEWCQRKRNERKNEKCKYEDPGFHSAQDIMLMQYIRQENEALNRRQNAFFYTFPLLKNEHVAACLRNGLSSLVDR